MTKQEQAKLINQAIKRSSVAQQRGAHVEVLEDGRIEYTMLGKSTSGRPYRMKVPRGKIIGTLWGEDMRRLHGILKR